MIRTENLDLTSMVLAADLPYAARRLHFGSQPLNHRSIDSLGGYLESAHPLGRAASSSAGTSRLHRPPYPAYSLDQRECYGAYSRPGHRPPPFDGHRPDHNEGCCDRRPGVLSASIPLPLPDRRASYREDSSCVAPAPDLPPARHTSPRTSSTRSLLPQRGPDILPVPSPSTRSPQLERCRYPEGHNRVRDENRRRRRRRRSPSRSPHFLLPPRVPKSLTPYKPYQWEDGRKGSTSLPTPKRYRLDKGRKFYSGIEHLYDDDERRRSRDHDGGHARDLTFPSSYDHGHCYRGGSMGNIPCDHGKQNFIAQHHSSSRKPPSPRSIEMSPWNDGYKSPSSPTYCCEDEIDAGRDKHGDDRAERFASDWSDSVSGAYEGSGNEIAGRVPKVKCEDLLKKKTYDALLDDFMDAVSANWRKPVSPDIGVDEGGYQEQTKRFAELALKRYNKNKSNKVKYSLVEATDGSVIFEDSELYVHVNFYANAKNGPKKYDPKVLVFAELHHIGRRPNAMILKSFHILDGQKQFSGRYRHIRSSPFAQDRDTRYCYACDDDIKHPEGPCYKAGHFVDILRYSYD